MVALFPSLLQVRKVRHSPAIYLTKCVLGKGGGENPPAPSRQLAGALGAYDLIKIIVLLHSHVSEGQGELCGASFALHSIHRLQGLKQTPQPFNPIPACSGLLLQKVVLFSIKYVTLF